MLVEEPVQVNIEKNQSDIWHWYPPFGRKSAFVVSVGDKARCGHICDAAEFSAYPNGSECVVCAELKRT